MNNNILTLLDRRQTSLSGNQRELDRYVDRCTVRWYHEYKCPCKYHNALVYLCFIKHRHKYYDLAYDYGDMYKSQSNAVERKLQRT